MKRCSRLLFHAFFTALSLAACLPSVAQFQVRITEVNPSTRSVEVTNFGASTVDFQAPTAWFFCHQFTYPSLTGSIGAGESRQFTVNFNQTASDLCLYSSSDFLSTASMQDFVQWGSGGNGRESVAVAKQIWTTGTFLPLAPTGKSYHARGISTTGLRSGNWFVGWPHAGFPVPDITFESIAVTGGEWRIIAQSPYLTSAHRVDVRADLTGPWQQFPAPTIIELGNGRIDVRFSAAGLRQFASLRAEF